MTQTLWHLLQVSDVLDLELGSALSESVPLIAWEPQRIFLPLRVPPGMEQERLSNHNSTSTPPQPVRLRRLPLLRGFARPPISWIARTGPSVLERLLRQTPNPERAPLVCTVPFFASVAERWPGPIIYWLTDLIAEYSSADRNQVIELDRHMVKAATLLCPNSRVLAQYLIHEAHAGSENIHIVPNATRASNVLSRPPQRPAAVPAVLDALPRPIAGVIGNLAGNMDWVLLERLVSQTPWLSWAFVGSVSMAIKDQTARRAREAVMAQTNACFVGRRPYGELASFARCFDVAFLPYRRCQPTYSGSSTRFYEHLAACRPMIATRGLEELTLKAPLLRLVDTAAEAMDALEELRSLDFDDGLLELRWRASRQNTWQIRAQDMQQALAQRLHPASSANVSCVTELTRNRA